MKRIEALKYYSIGKEYDPDAAQKRLEALREKHPDREYALLINVRSNYRRVMVAQVEKVAVDWPDPEEASLPPFPERPTLLYSDPNHNKAYADYRDQCRTITKVWDKVYSPLRDALFGKLN